MVLGASRRSMENPEGFEHAATLADMDRDGKLELYVASDEHDEVRRYRWTGRKFERKVIYGLNESDLTWAIELCP